MFGNTRKAVALACGYLKPLFEERRAKMEEFGDRWEDKPVHFDLESHHVAQLIQITYRTIYSSGYSRRLRAGRMLTLGLRRGFC